MRLRLAVTRVLDEPSLATTARGFQQRMRALPPAGVAIDEVEALI
jgi:hypothetical protein